MFININHIDYFVLPDRKMTRCTLLAAALTLAVSAPLPPHAISWSPLGEPGCGGDIVAARIAPYNTSHIYISGDMLGVGVSLDSGKVRCAGPLPPGHTSVCICICTL